MADRLKVGDWVKHRDGWSTGQILRVEHSSTGNSWAAVQFYHPDQSATYWVDNLVKLTPEEASKAQLTVLEDL